MTTDLEKAANARALEILGEKQFNSPHHEAAKDGIIEDFTAGAEWRENESEEKRTTKNMEIVSSFAEHYKSETGKEIEESAILSFFNA